MKGLEGRRGGVKQFKVIQENLSNLIFLLVPDDTFNDDVMAYIKKQCLFYFGPDMNIDFEICDFIQREKSGKLKDFVSRLE